MGNKRVLPKVRLADSVIVRKMHVRRPQRAFRDVINTVQIGPVRLTPGQSPLTPARNYAGAWG